MAKRNNDKARNPAQQKPVDEQASVISSQSVEFTWQGPLPPPVILKEYESMLPGSAERILKMIEGQAAHRIEIESTVIKGDDRRSFMGLIFGFVIALAALGGAIFLIYNDKNVAGLIIATTAIAGLVGAFVYGASSRRAERTLKASNLPQVRKS